MNVSEFCDNVFVDFVCTSLVSNLCRHVDCHGFHTYSTTFLPVQGLSCAIIMLLTISDVCTYMTDIVGSASSRIRWLVKNLSVYLQRFSFRESSLMWGNYWGRGLVKPKVCFYTYVCLCIHCGSTPFSYDCSFYRCWPISIIFGTRCTEFICNIRVIDLPTSLTGE